MNESETILFCPVAVTVLIKDYLLPCNFKAKSS